MRNERARLLRQMEKLARSRGNDAVKLAFLDGENLEALEGLNLAALTEFRRSGNGGVEIRLVDRVALLKLLVELSGTEEEKAEAFFGPGSRRQRKRRRHEVPAVFPSGSGRCSPGGAARRPGTGRPSSATGRCAAARPCAWGCPFSAGPWAPSGGSGSDCAARPPSPCGATCWRRCGRRWRSWGSAGRSGVSRNQVKVRFGGWENTFYLFGGRDEGSAALIQGVTLAGVLLDEAALMPRSFVEQAVARCSVEGSRLWVLLQPGGAGALVLPGVDPEGGAAAGPLPPLHHGGQPGPVPRGAGPVRAGVQRHLLPAVRAGRVGGGQGRVYDFFDESWVRPAPEGEMEQWRISCDYGTANRPPSGCGAAGGRMVPGEGVLL